MSIPTEKVAGLPIKATFLISAGWANRAAVYPLLEAATESHHLQDVLIVPVTEYDLSDGVFMSITFYPRCWRAARCGSSFLKPKCSAS